MGKHWREAVPTKKPTKKQLAKAKKKKKNFLSPKKHWRWDRSEKKWKPTHLGRQYDVKPPAKVVTPPPKIIRTKPEAVPVPVFQTIAINDANREIMKAFRAISAVELFQYLNNHTIEGILGPNELADLARRMRESDFSKSSLDITLSFIKDIYVQGNMLVIDHDDTIIRNDVVVEFYTAGIESIKSSDYQ